MNNDPIGPTSDIDPNKEWSEAYDCFADSNFLSKLSELLVINEKKFRRRRRGLREAGEISLADLQTRVGTAA